MPENKKLNRCKQQKTRIKNMDIVHRLPPLVGLYEVVKFLDPRLLQIQFYKNENPFTSCVPFSYSPRYVEGHDTSGNLIYNRIKKNGTHLYLLMSQIKKKNGKHRYYLTFVKEQWTSIEIELRYSSIYAGKDMESAVFKYLEHVTDYGV